MLMAANDEIRPMLYQPLLSLALCFASPPAHVCPPPLPCASTALCVCVCVCVCVCICVCVPVSLDLSRPLSASLSFSCSRAIRNYTHRSSNRDATNNRRETQHLSPTLDSFLLLLLHHHLRCNCFCRDTGCVVCDAPTVSPQLQLSRCCSPPSPSPSPSPSPPPSPPPFRPLCSA